jgi:tetratricopeptide (TPR) repeat protein
MEIATRIATAPPPDLREATPDLPPEAAAVLARGMAREPGDRQHSAGELAAELASALERPQAAPATARTTPLPARASAWRPSRTAAIAAALLGLAAAAVLAIVLVSGGDEGGTASRAGDRAQPAQPSQRERTGTTGQPAQPEASTLAAEPAKPKPAKPKPAKPGPSKPAPDASGADLNNYGYLLMQRGDYAAAVPILQRAVGSFPAGTSDLNYAYALFNLGSALLHAGRPQEAIPILQQRLRIPNQRGAVKRELEAAVRAAGG